MNTHTSNLNNREVSEIERQQSVAASGSAMNETGTFPLQLLVRSLGNAYLCCGRVPSAGWEKPKGFDGFSYPASAEAL